jgi:putative glutamine amidotransferase
MMKRVALTFDDGYDVEPYSEALRDAGMEPVLVTPTRPVDSLSGIHGLLLSGGADLEPALYGQDPHPESQSPLLDRDALEQRLLREALESGVPILAICRGMQLFNITHPGGTLVQHIEGHRVVTPEDRAKPAHTIEVAPGTRLAAIMQPGDHPVNSRHHQAVAAVGRGLVVSARSKSDGVIEALERPDHHFAIAVQWHPENQVHRFPEHKSLFLALSDAL